MDSFKENNIPTQTAFSLAQLDKQIDPLQDGISSVELIRVSGSDVDIVNAARVSFGKVVTKMSTKDENLIKYLLEHNHSSPFEHNQLSFRIKAPIFVVRQWMRHRMSSYNEISYRYVQSALEFYIPNEWRYQSESNRQASCGAFQDSELRAKYQKSLNESSRAYHDLLSAGVCREQARAVLPVCTYSEFIYTCNLHSFMHFLNLRMSAGAQLEIKVYAQAMLELALPHFGVALQAWQQIHLNK